MLTVEENLRLALVAAGIKNERRELEKAYIMFPVLKEKRQDKSRTLSGGQLQMVANARALLGPVRLILMDEPTEGLSPILIEQIGQSILEMKLSGKTVLLAEQHLQMAMAVGDRHYIIDNGHVVFQGTSKDIQDNEEIKTTYLGVSKKGILTKKGDC
jgi:branched-chain amino acid transport system ATP-binding protein